MKDREVLSCMGVPAVEEREWVHWLGVKPGPAPGPPRTAPEVSLA
jgi:hypothetical protein